jgi:hypothetical protein
MSEGVVQHKNYLKEASKITSPNRTQFRVETCCANKFENFSLP